MQILHLLLFIIGSVLSQHNIEVKDSGIYPMTPGDVGMVFFIKLYNPCTERYHINVKMGQCTEEIGDAEEESSAIYLIGGYMGQLYSKSTLIATLIYPNMYLYNRQGQCTIIISYTDENHVTHQSRTQIKFNTMPKEGTAPPEIKSFYQGRSFKFCESPDLDPLEKCTPVDCMMKYLGNRNYYNDKWKRCQKVPVCISDGIKDEPDVSYVPTSNRCRNLANCITENDIGLLEEGIISNDSGRILSSRGLILRCNHGCLDNVTGVCQCSEGYGSTEPDIDNYVPGVSVYHMCNIRVDSWNQANLPKIRSTIFVFSILAVIITMIILLITFCLYGVYLFVKSYEEISPFENISTESSEMESQVCEIPDLERLQSRNKTKLADE